MLLLASLQLVKGSLLLLLCSPLILISLIFARLHLSELVSEFSLHLTLFNGTLVELVILKLQLIFAILDDIDHL